MTSLQRKVVHRPDQHAEIGRRYLPAVYDDGQPDLPRAAMPSCPVTVSVITQRDCHPW
jgi:hypothetical protein